MVASVVTSIPILAQELDQEYVAYGEHRCTVTIEPASCIRQGKTIYNCVDCGEKFTKPIKNLQHKELKTKINSTYFEPGYKNRVVCSYCGKVLKKGETIAKKKLPKVKKITAKTVASDTVKLSWKKVEDVDGYLVYKRVKGAKKFKKIKTVKGACSVKISGLVCGKKYEVQVKAYASKNKKTLKSEKADKKEVSIGFNSINKFDIKTSQYCFPLKGERVQVTSLYGWRKLNGYKDWHEGIDLDGETGDKIMAFKSGTVVKKLYKPSSWGKYVLIYHGKVNGKKIYSGYAHLSKVSVKKGQKVVQGQKIGEVGNTGRSFGSHLHFEIYKGGTNAGKNRVDPTPYLGIKNQKGWQKVR